MPKWFLKFDRYLFGDIPLHSLGLYRATIGTFLFLRGVTWFPHTEELFSTEGFHVRHVLFSAVLSPFDAQLVCMGFILCSFLLAIGYLTRVAIPATFFFFGLLFSVDTINEKAVESVYLVVLCILFLSPCQRVFSVDAYLRRRAGKPYRPYGTAFFNRLLMFEFAQIYFFAGFTKMMVPRWVSGEVFVDSLAGRWASETGVWLTGALTPELVKISGFGTILFELFIGPLLFNPSTQTVAVFLAVAFHSGIEIFMNVGFLGPTFILSDLLLFLRPVYFEKAFMWVRTFYEDCLSALGHTVPGREPTPV